MNLSCPRFTKRLLFLASSLFTIYSFGQTVIPTGKPNAFIENKGQIVTPDGKTASNVLYMYCDHGLKVQVHPNSLSFELYGFTDKTGLWQEWGRKFYSDPADFEDVSREPFDSYTYNSSRVDVHFIGANPNPEVVASNAFPYYSNYYNEYTPESGITEVKSYQTITYKNLYKGIDLVLQTYQQSSDEPRHLSYDFVVHPGADPSKIRYTYNGVDQQQLLPNGTLSTKNKGGQLLEVTPVSYNINPTGTQKPVNAAFSLKDNIISFNVPHYDKKQTLVIDPYFLWATYCGGTLSEEGRGLTVDSSNNVILLGRTYSTDNIATPGAFQDTLNGQIDILLEKYTEDGSRIWGTYFGGEGLDRGRGAIAFKHNEIYICGQTTSTTGVATDSAWQKFNAGGEDEYLALFDSSGFREWATYYGGPDSDISRRLAVDSHNNIYMVGYTASPSGIAYGTAFQKTFGGFVDISISKWTPDGKIIWGGYYGGKGEDHGRSITIDKFDNIYINGSSGSNDGIATPGAWQTQHSGGQDFVVARLDTSGNLIWGTYYGGLKEDRGRGVYCDSHGNVYTVGYSASSGLATPGAFQMEYDSSVNGGKNENNHDGMVMRWTPDGKLVWATYIGREPDDRIRAVTIINDYIFSGGTTQSDDTIATPDAFQTVRGGGEDMFFEKWDSNGHRIWGTYFGAKKRESTLALAKGIHGKLYAAGSTSSPDGIDTTGVGQPIFGGDEDALLVKFSDSAVTTGMNNIPALAQDVSLAPNPCINSFKISFDKLPSAGNADMVLYDTKGNRVMSLTLDTRLTNTVNVSSLLPGLYNVNIQLGNQTFTRKVVIMR